MKLPRKQLKALLRQRVQRQDPPPKKLSWGAIAGIIGFITSLAAFGFSTVAFLNSIKAEDDVRADLGPDNVKVSVDKEARKLSLEAFGSFTIINSGNRMVAIRGITMTAFMPNNKKESATPCNSEGATYWLPLSRKPFLVKAGDITIEPVTSVPIVIAAEDIRRGRREYALRVCVAFLLATPDEFISAQQVVYDNEFDGLDGAGVVDITPDKKPRVLYHKTSTMFAK